MPAINILWKKQHLAPLLQLSLVLQLTANNSGGLIERWPNIDSMLVLFYVNRTVATCIYFNGSRQEGI